VTVPITKALPFTKAMKRRNWRLVTGSFDTIQRIELKIATVAMKAKVVQAVLHLLSAETLYRNLWVPKKNNAIMA
jgi:hypothetical protein